MHAKASNLGNTCRQMQGNSLPFFCDLPQQSGFDLSHQCIRNQVGVSTDWRKQPGVIHFRYLIRNKIFAIFSSGIHYEQEQQAYDIANILENWLFIDAASKEEYMNLETLIKRLETPLNKLHATKYSQQADSSITNTSNAMPSSVLLHAWSNGTLLEPASRQVAGPITGATDFAVAVDNKSGLPKGGLSHQPVFSPHACSSIPACTDKEMLSNFSVSGGGRNLEASSKSISSYFPQQQADNVEMQMIKYRDCSGTMQKDDSMAFLNMMGNFESSKLLTPQHASREVSEVSNLLPGLSSLGDTRQYQHQKLDIQQSLNHSIQPYELRGNIYMTHPSSCFVNQGEHSCQMLGQKSLKQPQCFKILLNGNEQFTSESSAYLYGLDGSANMNSYSSSQVPVTQRILLAYFHKNLNSVSQANVLKYLHSAVCCKGTCACEQYSKLLLHFDGCRRDDCHICYSWKLGGTDILERQSEFPNSVTIGSVARENDAPSVGSKAMLPTTKRQKMEYAFDVSLINNALSDQLTPKMVQPHSFEVLSEFQQHQESSLSSIYSEVTECNVEQFTNPMLDSISNIDTKNSVIDDTVGQTFKMETVISKGLEADHISEELDLKSHDAKANNNLEENVGSNSNMHTLCKELLADVEDSVIDDTVGQTFKIETVISKGLEADHISEELDLKIHDAKDNNNLEENVVGSNSNMHTLCKELPADIEDSVIDDTVGQTFKMEIVISKGLGADHISEELDLKSHDAKANSNLKENVVGSNSNMHTLCKEPPANIEDNVIDDTVGQTFKMETVISKGLEADHISEELDLKSHDVKANNNLQETFVGSNSNMHSLCKELWPADIEDIQGRTRFDKAGVNATKKIIDPKADQEKETRSSNPTVDTVSLTDFFTSNQLMDHIMSLRRQFVQSRTDEESENAAYICQLCEMGQLYFALMPIYCLCCNTRIKQNANYYCSRAEESDTQHCFCTVCYRNSRGGHITFNGTSVSKSLLDKKTNSEPSDEPWVQCNTCKSWQHQICALYNVERDFDQSAEYICPICRLKEIENGMHVPLPKTAAFGAKDLPSTMLSDHIERRLFKRLMQEREDWAKVEGNKNLDEVLVAEHLSVRVVLCVDKQLKVKKEFLDIFSEEDYPAEFSYTSKVILLFQQIEGVDVCLFGMYVQEFGSGCGYPNRGSVYISYLDSVKYFRPKRETTTGEALRTFVYHEILIGYLYFCKKRGFTTCYLWACPPLKGEDYILYCHPDTQKTPKKDKLRNWYHSMLRKAAEENIVVGLTDMYDHFFVPTGDCDSKVSAACLPYFDGDYWSGAAMDIARKIEHESRGEYEKMLKKLASKRTLKAMGHVNPSKATAKNILVMQKLGQTILPVKEDFIVIHLHYVCIHCHEVIGSGKRWFCTECKKFQECERCHTADSHISIGGEKHTLCQVLMNDSFFDTKENDIILDNGLFEDRQNFLSFCQKKLFQFDTLRRAKYSSMMILYHLKNPTLLTVGTICSICFKRNVLHWNWKCEICPEFTVCFSCYKERGAICHVHKLSRSYSRAQCPSGNKGSKQKLIQELQEVMLHASQCHSTRTQPCSYPHCLKIKKLFSHASRCAIRVSGGCQYCMKAWLGITAHSRNCRDSECRIPRCKDLKKHAEQIAMQSKSQCRAAVVESNKAPTAH
ncbi:uncharacterized protein LOC113866525 [Abrus precatorius]|uniref:histone acetyltransferase n=1 Tax=Abrus precatorius TaxID=3816 RepID=A0A8B8LLL6_ABRPR|nr:uncharacterized protein LOC113866525 [Abrus precatorius]